jgi:hypothetical protein
MREMAQRYKQSTIKERVNQVNASGEPMELEAADQTSAKNRR